MGGFAWDISGRVGEEDRNGGGGTGRDFRVFCAPTLFREVFGRAGEGRTGEESSAPDWKMLLSSQPLSSPCEKQFQLLCSDNRVHSIHQYKLTGPATGISLYEFIQIRSEGRNAPHTFIFVLPIFLTGSSSESESLSGTGLISMGALYLRDKVPSSVGWADDRRRLTFTWRKHKWLGADSKWYTDWFWPGLGCFLVWRSRRNFRKSPRGSSRGRNLPGKSDIMHQSFNITHLS